MQRIFENIFRTSENREEPRSYYIPEGISEYTLLNGEWDFAFFKRDIDVPKKSQNGIKSLFPPVGRYSDMKIQITQI